MDATEEDAHALCLGLYMLSIRDGAEDFQTWQAEHDQIGRAHV